MLHLKELKRGVASYKMVQLKIRTQEQASDRLAVIGAEKSFAELVHRQKVSGLLDFLIRHFTFHKDLCVSRATIESMYNNYITENGRYLDLGIGTRQFGAVMDTICKERGLEYKRRNYGNVYIGLCLTSDVPQSLTETLTEQQKRSKHNAKRKDQYTYNINGDKLKAHVRAYKRKVIIDGMKERYSWFNTKYYKILKDNNLITWCYLIPENMLPWENSVFLETSQESAKEMVDRCIQIRHSIICTIERYEYWKEKTGYDDSVHVMLAAVESGEIKGILTNIYQRNPQT